MNTLLNRLTGRSAALLLALALSGCNLPLQTPDCPPGQSLGADQLLGNWTLQMAGLSTPWALSLAPHPEHIGSLRGELRQGDQRHLWWPTWKDASSRWKNRQTDSALPPPGWAQRCMAIAVVG